MLVALRRPVPEEFTTVLHDKGAFELLTVDSCRIVPEEFTTMLCSTVAFVPVSRRALTSFLFTSSVTLRELLLIDEPSFGDTFTGSASKGSGFDDAVSHP